MPEKRTSASRRGYGRKWQAARAVFLQAHPLCAMCQQRGVVTAAQVVDHIVPHRQDMKLFWDRKNWQPLCHSCHCAHKQRLERSGDMMGCDEHGLPLDPHHFWHQPKG